MRTEVSATTMHGPEAELSLVRAAETDLRSAGKVTGEVGYAAAETFGVSGTVLVEVASGD